MGSREHNGRSWSWMTRLQPNEVVQTWNDRDFLGTSFSIPLFLIYWGISILSVTLKSRMQLDFDKFRPVFSVNTVYLNIFFLFCSFVVFHSSFSSSHSLSTILICICYFCLASSYPLNLLCSPSHSQTHNHAPFCSSPHTI